MSQAGGPPGSFLVKEVWQMTNQERYKLEDELENLLMASKPSPYDAVLIVFDLCMRVLLEAPMSEQARKRVTAKLADLEAEAGDEVPDDLLNN
jgi:hypothetical protein